MSTVSAQVRTGVQVLLHEVRLHAGTILLMQKNPDGLIIEELGKMFKEMEKGEGVVCPL